jgi:hypothetical protein
VDKQSKTVNTDDLALSLLVVLNRHLDAAGKSLRVLALAWQSQPYAGSIRIKANASRPADTAHPSCGLPAKWP